MKKQLLFKCLFFGLALFSATSFAQSALKFDGTNDYVLTNSVPLTGSGSRTVEAWIKTTANSTVVSGVGQNVICDWGTFNSTGARFTLNLTSNKLRLEVSGSGLNGTSDVNDGQWHHVAAVYNASAANNVSLYVDGVLETQGNLSVAVNTGSATSFRIGQRIDGLSFFNGSIDDVKVWNVAKSAADIVADMNTEFCATQSGLVRYYKFNNGVPDGNNISNLSTPDYSGNNSNGSLTNFTLTGTVSNYTAGTTLNLLTLDLSVTTSGSVITANETGAGTTYQWIDCDNGNINIAGQTGQSFTATANGNYAVVIKKNGCIDKSVCVQIVNLSIAGFDLTDQIKVYPNPTNGVINLAFGTAFETVKTIITNSIGQTILEKTSQNSSDLQLNLNAPNGIYFVTVIIDNEASKTFKIVNKN
jgi:hypothetical protein